MRVLPGPEQPVLPLWNLDYSQWNLDTANGIATYTPSL